MSDRELLLEMHQMLVKICNYIDKVESPEYQRLEWERDFNNNMITNLASDRLSQIRDKIYENRKS